MTADRIERSIEALRAVLAAGERMAAEEGLPILTEGTRVRATWDWPLCRVIDGTVRFGPVPVNGVGYLVMIDEPLIRGDGAFNDRIPLMLSGELIWIAQNQMEILSAPV